MVLDASALVEMLLGTAPGRQVAGRISNPAESLHVPHLADVEVAQALRRLARQGEIGAGTAREAIQNLHALDLERHAHEPLLDRVWALRANLTAHDAVYIALAESLDALLLTCDAALGRWAARAEVF